MKWSETVASKCRWAEFAAPIFEDDYYTDIIWEHSEADYQGHASLLARDTSDYGRAKYIIGGWTYGSCSGCDGWEDESRLKIMTDMATSFKIIHSKDALANYLAGIIKQNPHWEEIDDDDAYDSTKSKIKAIQAELARKEDDE